MKTLIFVLMFFAPKSWSVNGAVLQNGTVNPIKFSSGTVSIPFTFTSTNTYANGSSINSLAGSTVTLNGQANTWIMVSSQDYASPTATTNNCPSTVSFILANLLNLGEVSTSSITWRVDFDLTYSSAVVFYPELAFNNDTQQHYGMLGSQINQAATVSGFGQANSGGFAVPFTGSTGSGPEGGSGLGSDFHESAEFTVAVSSANDGGSALTVLGNIGNTYFTNQSKTGIGGTLGGVFIYQSNSTTALTTVHLVASTVYATSQSDHKIPMCGHYELWRKGFQHQ